MNRAAIDHAAKEAVSFLERYDELTAEDRRFPNCFNPKQSGALRRASMDLTRALADMRRPS